MNNSTLCPFCFEPMTTSGNCPHCGHHVGEPSPGIQQLPVGWILDGKYRIGMTLGQGGFGITYLAYDMNLQQKVAIKEYFPSGLVTRSSQFVTPFTQSGLDLFNKGVDAFYREARLLAQFSNHPNVVHIQNFFRENYTAYFVMEYVEGNSLAAYLDEKGGRLSLEETISLLSPIMDALDVLHHAGILHRDIAPDNIYLTKSGQVKLLDFGAAKNELSQHTHSSAAILKPGYAPLEQYSVTGNQGSWTDVYAMGAVIYRCLTGIMPPDAPDRMTGREVAPISNSGRKVPKNVDAAVMKALAINIPDRWQSMSDFKNALSDPNLKIEAPKAQSRPSASAGNSTKTKTRKNKSNNFALGIALIVVIAGLVLVLGRGKIPFLQPEPSPTPTLLPTSTPTITPFPTVTPTMIAIPTSSETTKPYVSGILQVGDEFLFGSYEQNNNLSDGKEGIEWQVLFIENDRALVISKFTLDVKPYQDTMSFAGETWSGSTLRTWLNNDFYNNAFSASDHNRIIQTVLQNPNNPEYGTDGGAETTDNIFLLSIDESNLYFSSLSDRSCEATAYAKAQGAFVDQNNGNSRWWLRSPGYSSTDAAYVDSNGNIPTHGNMFSDNVFTVRPAFWFLMSPAESDAETTASTNTYTVLEGDNCWSIAEKYSVPLESFMAVNNMTYCDINIGDQVIIPVVEKTSQDQNLEPILDNFEPKPGDNASYESQIPSDETHFAPGQNFNIVWYFWNIGSTTWTNNYSIRFFSGDNFMNSSDNRQYLTKNVAPGRLGELYTEAIAPSQPGTYRMSVVLSNSNDENFYVADITIIVD